MSTNAANATTSPHDDEHPTVFKFNTIKRKPKLKISFHFASYEMRLSLDLYRHLGLSRADRVAFVSYKGSFYITRCDHPDAFYVVTINHGKAGLVAAIITKKAYTEYLRVLWGNKSDDLLRVPVADFQTKSTDLNLDPKEYPYPLYRLITDQKSLRQ